MYLFYGYNGDDILKLKQRSLDWFQLNSNCILFIYFFHLFLLIGG